MVIVSVRDISSPGSGEVAVSGRSGWVCDSSGFSVELVEYGRSVTCEVEPGSEARYDFESVSLLVWYVVETVHCGDYDDSWAAG